MNFPNYIQKIQDIDSEFLKLFKEASLPFIDSNERESRRDNLLFFTKLKLFEAYCNGVEEYKTRYSECECGS